MKSCSKTASGIVTTCPVKLFFHSFPQPYSETLELKPQAWMRQWKFWGGKGRTFLGVYNRQRVFSCYPMSKQQCLSIYWELINFALLLCCFISSAVRPQWSVPSILIDNGSSETQAGRSFITATTWSFNWRYQHRIWWEVSALAPNVLFLEAV